MNNNKVAGPLLAPINPHFAARDKQGPLDAVRHQNKGYGFRHSPLKLDHLKGRQVFGLTQQSLPSSFDLRKKGRVSPVEDQGPAGTCWAFASYGSLESCLLPEEHWDFSENNMKNLLSIDCPEGYDREADGGGNQFMSTAYMARWSGPVAEETDPYDPTGPVDCTQYPPRKLLTRVVYVPDRKKSTDNQNLKTAMYNYGAVFTTIYFEDKAYQDANDAYYYKGEDFSNHAICLVGWDDAFPRSRFRTRPPGDGAFIAKNSWGTSWGDKGFFYISYYDSRVGSDNALFNRVNNPSAYSALYQYDPLGWVSSVGYGETRGWFANIFRAGKPGKLGAVSSYAASPGSTYELYIYKSPEAGNPRSGQLALTIKGTVEDPAFFTRVLSSQVELNDGQTFSIVLNLNTPGYNYPIPVEMPFEGYSSKARAANGQSFISRDGAAWDDINAIWENTNVCIKALAK